MPTPGSGRSNAGPLLGEPEQVDQRGQHQDARQADHDQQADQGGVAPAAASIVTWSTRSHGYCATPQPVTTEPTATTAVTRAAVRRRYSRTSVAAPAIAESANSGAARCAARGERGRVMGDRAQGREDDAPVTMPTASVRIAAARPVRVARRAASAVRNTPARKTQVRDRQAPAEQRRRVEPRARGRRSRPRDPPGRDGARRRAEEERRDQRGAGEDRAEQPGLSERRGVLAEREGRAAQHDAEQRQRRAG